MDSWIGGRDSPVNLGADLRRTRALTGILSAIHHRLLPPEHVSAIVDFNFYLWKATKERAGKRSSKSICSARLRLELSSTGILDG